MTRNTTVTMPGGDVEFDIAVGRDKTPWNGYATDLPGLLVARLPRYHTVPFGEHKATYRPATTWGIFHRGTGMRVLWLSYKTRREATHRANLLRDLDWSEAKWPDVAAEQLARILNPTREQELEERVAKLECRLQETREVLQLTFEVLDRMPADERIAFSLRFVEQMELTEVAEICGTSLPTAKRRIAKAERRFVTLAKTRPPLRAWLSQSSRWRDR